MDLKHMDEDVVSFNKIPEEQVEEIRKVFSLFDKDGDGSIDAKELGTIIAQCTGGNPPSEEEVKMLIHKMDANSDGVIQWSEFLAALTSWLVDEEKSEAEVAAKNRKRKAPSSPTQVRAKVHNKIRRFFAQFRRAANFAEIRQSFANSSRGIVPADGSIVGDSNEYSSDVTPAAKAEKLADCNAKLATLPQLITTILNSNDQTEATRCTIVIADILSICDFFRTPEERFEIGDFLVQIFQRVCEGGLLERIVKFLTCHDLPDLQYAAARIVSYIAPGPRVAHTPLDSTLHPDKMYHKSLIINSGAVAYLLPLLESPHLIIQEQAVVALGRIASNNSEARDFVLNLGAYPLLTSVIKEGTAVSLIRKTTWALSVLCGHTHLRSSPPPYETISAALPQFALLIYHLDDEETLVNVCTCLSFLLPGIVMEPLLSKRLCQLLRYNSSRVQKVILETIVDICRLDNSPIPLMLQSDLMVRLRELLTRADYSVRLEACELVSVISGEKGYTQVVLEAQIMPILVQLLYNDEYVRWKVVKIIKQAVRSAPTHIKHLVVHDDIIHVLASALQYFKLYDSVLRDVYLYLGPTYNFDFVKDILDAMDDILEAGETEARSAGTVHPYILMFDMDVVEKLKQVLLVICDEMDEKMDSWREKTNSPLENHIGALLTRIRAVYSVTLSPVSNAMCEHITSVLQGVEQKLKALQVAREDRKRNAEFKSAFPEASRDTITVKCFFNGDNRMLEVPRSMPLPQIALQVTLKYGRPLILQYQDEEGDKITLDSAALLAKALALMAKQNSNILKLYLLSPEDSNPASMSMSSGGGGQGRRSMDAEAKQDPSAKRLLLDALSKVTCFSKQDLEQLWSHFQRIANNGRVNKDQFERGLEGMGIKDRVMIDQFFTAFDHSKDGFVDFRELVVGLSVMYRGSMEERLQLAFKAYDIDGNGMIDRLELFHILKASFTAKDFALDDSTILTMVEKCFDAADLDRNGGLDFGEFKIAVLRHQIVVQSFWTQPLA